MDLLKRVLCTIVLVGIGFIIGRKTIEEKTVIKYVDLPPIQGRSKSRIWFQNGRVLGIQSN